MRVCHVTSAHAQEDIRIFFKECVSLANAGYDVYQISCGKTYEKMGVHLIGIGEQQSGRAGRMTKSAKEVYKASVEIDADVYHFHDPELLPYGLKLKQSGKKVIFDSHEDVPAQIMDKSWIPKCMRGFVSGAYRMYETHVVKRLDAVVTATPHIAESFRGRCKKVVVVNNYPRLDDIIFQEKPFEEREPLLAYAGGLGDNRGEYIMAEAIRGTKAQLVIAGDHEAVEIGPIKYLGKLDRNGVNALYGEAIAGLCLLKPIKNYYYSRPIKIYEYMAAGLPYICSDFPSWREVAEESGAGICVDPTDIGTIRKEIERLIEDRGRAQEMGRRGREYVKQKCNWSNEEKSLLSLYNSLEN